MPKRPQKVKKPQKEEEIQVIVQEVEKDLKSLDSLPNRINRLKMNSDKNYEVLLEEGRVVRVMQRHVEEKQKWAVEGLEDSIKSIRSSIRRFKSFFTPMINSCTGMLEIVDRKQIEYATWQEEEYEKEQERLRKEAEDEQKRLNNNAKRRAKRVEEDDPGKAQAIIHSVPTVEARTAAAPVAPKVEGVVKAKVWDFEIINPEIVPERVSCIGLDPDNEPVALWERDFNRKALLKVRELGHSIDGVRFFQKDQTRYGDFK